MGPIMLIKNKPNFFARISMLCTLLYAFVAAATDELLLALNTCGEMLS
jgi:hypothetical protein